MRNWKNYGIQDENHQTTNEKEEINANYGGHLTQRQTREDSNPRKCLVCANWGEREVGHPASLNDIFHTKETWCGFHRKVFGAGWFVQRNWGPTEIKQNTDFESLKSRLHAVSIVWLFPTQYFLLSQQRKTFWHGSTKWEINYIVQINEVHLWLFEHKLIGKKKGRQTHSKHGMEVRTKEGKQAREKFSINASKILQKWEVMWQK